MGEISRCCKVLGVEPGVSLEELKKAYRDLVQVWHPDRFANNERLQSKAQEHLKEINLAFDYLVANAFKNAAVVLQDTSEETSASVSPPKEPDDWEHEDFDIVTESPRRGLATALSGITIVLIGCGVFYYWEHHVDTHQSGRTAQERQTNVAASRPAVEPDSSTNDSDISNLGIPLPSSIQTNSTIRSSDILASMTPVNEIEVIQGPEGVILNSKGERDYIQASRLVRPPCVVKARAKTDLKDLRLYFGIGEVIFNWRDNPSELRIVDPVTGRIIPVARQGLVSPNDWHDLTWEMATNEMRVMVDGETRFESKGDYRRVKGYPAIGGYQDQVMVKSFSVESGLPIETAGPQGRVSKGSIRGDILSSMIPVNNPTVTQAPDGVSLTGGNAPADRDRYIITSQTFHAPFVIRTVVKTDSINVRLHAGTGGVIFNWEGNPSELRVHDPLTGRITPVPGRGFIWPNEWHEVVWEIRQTGMKISVDGQARFQNQKDYRSLQATPGIGMAWSKITVEYFVVEQK
ncbi:MAG TPA: J domain-containing protein [Candidatus Angelobacter sp.]|nr:J domain-containing protein [Candidatus Angelobacter sp.]